MERKEQQHWMERGRKRKRKPKYGTQKSKKKLNRIFHPYNFNFYFVNIYTVYAAHSTQFFGSSNFFSPSFPIRTQIYPAIVTQYSLFFPFLLLFIPFSILSFGYTDTQRFLNNKHRLTPTHICTYKHSHSHTTKLGVERKKKAVEKFQKLPSCVTKITAFVLVYMKGCWFVCWCGMFVS